jgi:hypothetical protein
MLWDGSGDLESPGDGWRSSKMSVEGEMIGV